MQEDFITIDIDGCVWDDIEAALSRHFLRRSAEQKAGLAYREFLFQSLNMIKTKAVKLLRNFELSPDAVRFMKWVQESGRRVRLETQNPNISPDAVREALAREGIRDVDVEFVADGKKGRPVNGVKPLLLVEDNANAALDAAGRGVSAAVLKKSYNQIAGRIASGVNGLVHFVGGFDDVRRMIEQGAVQHSRLPSKA